MPTDSRVTTDSQVLPHELSAIYVTPTNLILEVDLNTPVAQAYEATGHFLDGVQEDLTGVVTWSTSTLGAFNGSTLEIPGFTDSGAEVTRITASHQGITGQAQLTVVAYRQSGIQQDFFFILPFEDPDGEVEKPLDFATDVRALDLFFNMDVTGSMYGSITNLQNALVGTVIPSVQSQVADTWFGAGAFMDFPIDPYGNLAGSDCGRGGWSNPDQPFILFQEITNNVVAVNSGVGSYSTATGPIGCGNDFPESLVESLYQIATGEGLTGPAPTYVAANHNGVGGVAFREGSMPVVAAVTDAPSHTVGEGISCSLSGSLDYGGLVAGVAHSRQETKAALDSICAKVVGIAALQSGYSYPVNCSPLEFLEDFATATGARVPPAAWDVPARPANCPAGQCCTSNNGAGRAPDANGLCPLVFLVDQNGTGLSDNIVTGLKMLTRFAAFDVSTETAGEAQGVNGETLPVGTSTADFIKAIVPDSFQKPAPPPELPDPSFDQVNFYGVTPGTVVSFQVHAYNDFVPATETAQLFRAVIRVLAGGCTDLDQREVIILVPPQPVVVD